MSTIIAESTTKLCSQLSRSVETRWRYGWLRMVFRGACLFRDPIWRPLGGGGTRQAERTIAESLAALYRVGADYIPRGWREAQSSTSQEPKAQTGRFLMEKLISDHDLFSFYEGQQGVTNGQGLWGFFRDAHGFRRLDAGSRASFTSSRFPSPFFFFFFLLSSHLYLPMDLIITILPVVTKDLPLSPVQALQFVLSRCKFSTLTTRQPMVEFYLLTFPRFPLRKKEHKSYSGKNRTHDFRTSRCAAYLLDHSGNERLQTSVFRFFLFSCDM